MHVRNIAMLFLLLCLSIEGIAGLVIKTDGSQMGVSSDEAGMILATAKFETPLDLDWSGFTYDQSGYVYLGEIRLPWGGIPSILSESENLWTVYTSNVASPTVAIDIFSGVSLPAGYTFVDSSTARAIEIKLFAEIYETNVGPVEDVYYGSVYALNQDNLNISPVIVSNEGGDTASISIEENILSITTVQATDIENDTIKYIIEGGGDKDLFEINENSGELKFKSAPNFEAPGDSGSDNVYEVVVKAYDNYDGLEGSDTQTITVTVTNVEEEPVMVSPAEVTIGVGETTILTVVASYDEGTITGYYLGDDELKFTYNIDESAGELSFNTAPEFVSGGNNTYSVEVYATTSNPGHSVSQTITVTVSDEIVGVRITSNGGGSTAEISVIEGETAVTTVEAVSGGGDIEYSISGGDDADFFDIDSVTGDLAFKAAPDFIDPEDPNTPEDPNSTNGTNLYIVEVTASGDDGTDSQTLSVSIVQKLNYPEITSNGGGDTASIEIPENETAITTVTATVEGGGEITYGISGGADADLFTIDQESGVLTLVDGPDYEAPADSDEDNVYIVVVAATSEGISGTQAISVTVSNVNEVPVIGDGSDTASYSIEEDSTAIATVSATDSDGDTLSYVISGGADASVFYISENDGTLRFVNAPDFENPTDSNSDNVYVVEITVDDGNGASDSQLISVTVTNVNDPVFITFKGGGDTARVFIEERIQGIVKVTAIDQDGDRVLFSITGGADSSKFLIGGGGELYFVSPFEYLDPQDSDRNNSYIVEVTASDGYGGIDSQTITVYVTDAIEPEDAVELTLDVQKRPALEDGDPVGRIDYEGRLEIGQVITLFADPNSGYRVKSWAGADTNAGTRVQTLTLTKNRHKVSVQFEKIPEQKVTKAIFKAGSTRSRYQDYFIIQGTLGAGATHVPQADGTIEIKISNDVASGSSQIPEVLVDQAISYDDDKFTLNWPRKLTYKDTSGDVSDGKMLEAFTYDIRSGVFKITSKKQFLSRWFTPLKLTITIGDYSAFMVLYDQGANDVINGNKEMPVQFLTSLIDGDGIQSLTIDKKRFRNSKDGTQTGRLSGRFSTTYSPLVHSLTSAEILFNYDAQAKTADYAQKLIMSKNRNREIYSYKRSKDADPEEVFFTNAKFDFDKVIFQLSYKNATFDVENDNFTIVYGWDEVGDELTTSVLDR